MKEYILALFIMFIALLFIFLGQLPAFLNRMLELQLLYYTAIAVVLAVLMRMVLR